MEIVRLNIHIQYTYINKYKTQLKYKKKYTKMSFLITTAFQFISKPLKNVLQVKT